MKPILVTGPTGFLGSHLVEQLKRAEGPGRLRLFCYGASRYDNDPDVEVVHGDITSPEDVERAMQGVGEVYHLAGLVSRDPAKRWLLYDVHIEGTRHVCESALRNGVERVVAVSSSGTVAVSREPVVHDENSGYKVDVAGEWPYYLSKIFAEKLALSYVRRYNLPVVIANPALLLGPGDELNSSTGDVALFLSGQIPAFPTGGMCFVDARDAATGLMGAMRQGRVGERYLLGGVNWTFRRIIEKTAEISGRRPPMLELPVQASVWGARLLRGVRSLVGKPFDLDEVTIRMSAYFWYCNSAKAISELGFRAREPHETIADTVTDLKRRGG